MHTIVHSKYTCMLRIQYNVNIKFQFLGGALHFCIDKQYEYILSMSERHQSTALTYNDKRKNPIKFVVIAM